MCTSACISKSSAVGRALSQSAARSCATYASTVASSSASAGCVGSSGCIRGQWHEQSTSCVRQRDSPARSASRRAHSSAEGCTASSAAHVAIACRVAGSGRAPRGRHRNVSCNLGAPAVWSFHATEELTSLGENLSMASQSR
eukprot:scaffold116294_cov63-Phaeocystis_antarctica.AAC.4